MPWSRMAEPDPIAPDPAAAATTAVGDSQPRRRLGWLKVAVAAAVVIALVLAGRQLGGVVICGR